MSGKKWTALYWLVMGLLITYVLVLQYEKVNAPIELQERVQSQGELPLDIPVLLFFVREDGTVYAESAVRTDYAGILPYSTTSNKVPYIQFSGYHSWELF